MKIKLTLEGGDQKWITIPRRETPVTATVSQEGVGTLSASQVEEFQISEDLIRHLFRAFVRENFLKLQNKQRLVTPNPPPRYDEVYQRGVEWLDKL